VREEDAGKALREAEAAAAHLALKAAEEVEQHRAAERSIQSQRRQAEQRVQLVRRASGKVRGTLTALQHTNGRPASPPT
jgi:hypothetical protein